MPSLLMRRFAMVSTCPPQSVVSHMPSRNGPHGGVPESVAVVARTYGMEDGQLGDTSRACIFQSAIVLPGNGGGISWEWRVPDPNNLARFDSLSFAAAMGGDILSDVVVCVCWKENKKTRNENSSTT